MAGAESVCGGGSRGEKGEARGGQQIKLGLVSIVRALASTLRDSS